MKLNCSYKCRCLLIAWQSASHMDFSTSTSKPDRIQNTRHSILWPHDREWLSMRNFFAETISTRRQGKLSGSFTVHKILGCKIIPGTWAIRQSIPHLTRNTWLCLTRPWFWLLVLATMLSWSPWPQQLAHRPSAEAPSLQKPCNGAKSISQAKSQLAEKKAKNSSRRQEYSRRKIQRK